MMVADIIIILSWWLRILSILENISVADMPNVPARDTDCTNFMWNKCFTLRNGQKHVLNRHTAFWLGRKVLILFLFSKKSNNQLFKLPRSLSWPYLESLNTLIHSQGWKSWMLYSWCLWCCQDWLFKTGEAWELWELWGGKGTIENHFKDPAFTLRKRNLIPFFLLEKICTVLRQLDEMPRLFGRFVHCFIYIVCCFQWTSGDTEGPPWIVQLIFLLARRIRKGQ